MNQNDHHEHGGPPPFDPVAGTATGAIAEHERQWAMFAHLSALSALFTGGLGAIVGPLIIWLVKKDSMPFVDDQGKEALNFNITVAIAMAVLIGVGTVLLVVLIGFLFYLAAFALGVAWLVLVILGTIKANEGVRYRYPMTLRLIK